VIFENLLAALCVEDFFAEVNFFVNCDNCLVKDPLVAEILEEQLTDITCQLAHGQVTSCVPLDLRMLHFNSNDFTSAAKTSFVNLSQGCRSDWSWAEF